MKSIIIGAGTYGEVYAAYLQEGGVDIVGFLDDNVNLHAKYVRGIPVFRRNRQAGKCKVYSWSRSGLLPAG